MTRYEKFLARIKSRPPEAGFDDVRAVLEHHGWRLERRRGSHVSFRRHAGDGTIVVPLVAGTTVKRVYLDMIIEKAGVLTVARRKPLAHFLSLQYPFRADADPDGGYVVAFPDLPGCVTQTESIDDIAVMAEEARQLWIETSYAGGDDIPLPSYPEDYSGKFIVRVPRSLHRRLAESSAREGVSLNQHIVALLAEATAAPASPRAGEAPPHTPLPFREGAGG